MTIDDIRALPNDFLLASQVAEILHWNPHYIRIVARNNPARLPFPVLVHGNRTQIPKAAFVAWWEKEVSIYAAT